jgi:putative flippase GtrA
LAISLLGFEARDLFLRAAKTLAAGAFGVGIGYGVTLALVTNGLPYVFAAWPGYAAGFIANFSLQVKMRNILVKRA